MARETERERGLLSAEKERERVSERERVQNMSNVSRVCPSVSKTYLTCPRRV